METKQIKEWYDQLRACYLDTNDNASKVRKFRVLYEDFADIVTPNSKHLWLADRLKDFFKSNRNYKDLAKLNQLLGKNGKFNIAAHENVTVSNQQLKDLYKTLLEMVWDATDVQPDETSKILSGISDSPWYTLSLNNEQRLAVIDDSRVISVDAGPGTGKTYLLVWKIMQYLSTNNQRNVVALSYTTAAAKQLSKKFNECQQEAKDKGYISKDAKFPNCLTMTIHGYCLRMLMNFCKDYGTDFEYDIVDESDTEDISMGIAKKNDLMREIFTISQRVKSYIKSNGKTRDAIIADYMTEHNLIVVDQILDLFINNCKTNDFSEWMKGRADCLLVDEDQDLTPKIYHAIAAIAKTNPDMYMFFVGDPRQNIFAFNGGSYENFKDFVAKHRLNVSYHSLTKTYRCPQAIIDRVNPLNFTDCDNSALVLQDEETKGSFHLISSSNEQDEAIHIVNEIKHWNDYKHTIVLASVVKYLENTAKVLNRCKIPFVIKKGGSEMKPEIKVMNRCLKSVYNKRQNQINIPTKEGKIENTINNLRLSVKDGDLSLSECIKKISEAVDWHDIYAEASDTLEAYADMAKNYVDLTQFLYECSSRRDEDGFKLFFEDGFNVRCTTPDPDNNHITLSTIHSAKGLEWDNVILSGADDNTLPSWGSTTPEDINNDKKKYYVAVTRSKQNLIISYAATTLDKYGRPHPHNVSPFVVYSEKDIL